MFFYFLFLIFHFCYRVREEVLLRVEALRVEEDLEVDLLSLSLLLVEEVVAPVRLREEES